ncbi:PREDICTED: single-pass membrane and coiled-coil domain-containing protein 1 [Gekko japonicus]|uniref:Single-pass membrane and coiled-coil domain-containing protein 1 n=1 Tax=Gekko japonicus TaxID=146911 RepID=A0ABM1KCU9_GEKJA|nr:PREDICTED: single-pass membrane and coiled-coil domain-containing protein 1 [Gekko japonicus]
MLEKKALMKMDRESQDAKTSYQLLSDINGVIKIHLWMVENKLQSIQAQFTVLDSSMQKLSEKFELQSTILENQMDQNEMWASLLEDRLTSVEVNVLYNYTCKTIHYLRCQVLEKLPDLVGTLPTLSSILRKKGKNQRIRSAWESVLERLGLQEGNVKTLCAFFIAHSYDACYCPVNQRQNYSTDISSVITKVVKNQLLQQSLLSAVCLVENGKAGGVFQDQKALSKK